MDDALVAIARILNTIEEHYDKTSQSYDEGVYGSVVQST
jgi:hypothetical protein